MILLACNHRTRSNANTSRVGFESYALAFYRLLLYSKDYYGDHYLTSSVLRPVCFLFLLYSLLHYPAWRSAQGVADIQVQNQYWPQPKYKHTITNAPGDLSATVLVLKLQKLPPFIPLPSRRCPRCS